MGLLHGEGNYGGPIMRASARELAAGSIVVAVSLLSGVLVDPLWTLPGYLVLGILCWRDRATIGGPDA